MNLLHTAQILSVSIADPIRLDERAALVPVGLADAPELHRVVDANRDALAPWCAFARSVTLADTERFICDAIAQSRWETGFHFTVRERGAIVGMIALAGIDQRNRVGTLNGWLRSDARGRGLMTRAGCALLDWVFAELRLHRVELRIARGNQRARALAERLGAALDGRLVAATIGRDADERLDVDVFALLAGRWRQPQHSASDGVATVRGASTDAPRRIPV